MSLYLADFLHSSQDTRQFTYCENKIKTKPMRLLLMIFTLVGLISCDSRPSFDSVAAVQWSKTPKVQLRSEASTYSFQRLDGSWVSISTAINTETESGLMCDGSEILKTGYITYPGGARTRTINEAIAICSKITGAKYKSEN